MPIYLAEFDYGQNGVVSVAEFKLGMAKWLSKMQMSRAMSLKSSISDVWEVNWLGGFQGDKHVASDCYCRVTCYQSVLHPFYAIFRAFIAFNRFEIVTPRF
jgi:hypothetical protein